MRTTTLLGLEISALTMDESVEVCSRLISERGHQHVVVNASKTVLASKCSKLREIINECELVNADGQSIVWAGKFLGTEIPERVTGIDLMQRLVAIAPKHKWTVYLLGAREEVVMHVATIFRNRGIEVVGARNGYWNRDEEAMVIQDIAKMKPDLLFVAMPSPRKEFFLNENLPNLNVGLAFGVGGSFDVIAGKTKRAPRWMQKSGLEWFYRFLQEPRRMAGRYFFGNVKFMTLVLRAKFGRRH